MELKESYRIETDSTITELTKIESGYRQIKTDKETGKKAEKKKTNEEISELIAREGRKDVKFYLNNIAEWDELKRITEDTPETYLSEKKQDIRLIKLLKKMKVTKKQLEFIKEHSAVVSFQYFGNVKAGTKQTFLLVLSNGLTSYIYLD